MIYIQEELEREERISTDSAFPNDRKLLAIPMCQGI
jgi:hypothetical protein